MRRTALVAVVVLVSVAATRDARARACRRGRFLFARDAVVEGGAGGLETISLDPAHVAISLGCRRVEPVFTPTRGGTRVTAAWPRCADLLDAAGRPTGARLRAFIASPACDTLTGMLVVRRATPRRRSFTAVESRCGDGYLDRANGEECGDEGATCPAGATCTGDCRCAALPTTTTTTTRSSSTTSTTLPANFTCTEILGFSQTLQWMDTPEFQARIDDPRWQARLHAGGDVDYWADPNADAWTSPPVDPTCAAAGLGLTALCSLCADGSAAPDRVLFTITLQAYESDVAVWAQKIRAAIATIRAKHPSVRQIVLQPVVGGPMGQVCPVPTNVLGVRASYNQPFIAQAIAQVIQDAPDLVAGDTPDVQACADYLDDVGHLQPAARGPLGAAIGSYYGP